MMSVVCTTSGIATTPRPSAAGLHSTRSATPPAMSISTAPSSTLRRFILTRVGKRFLFRSWSSVGFWSLVQRCTPAGSPTRLQGIRSMVRSGGLAAKAWWTERR